MSDNLSILFNNLSVASSSEGPSSEDPSTVDLSTVASSSEGPSTVRKIHPNPVRKAIQVLYIGVKLKSDEINTIISSKLPRESVNDKNPKDEFHITLEFKPKDITQHLPDGTPCNITIEGFGSSADAIAFKVSGIVTKKGDKVFHVLKEGGIPHITVALAPGIKPADSYLAICDGIYTKFAEPITLDGNIKYYYPEYKPKNI